MVDNQEYQPAATNQNMMDGGQEYLNLVPLQKQTEPMNAGSNTEPPTDQTGDVSKYLKILLSVDILKALPYAKLLWLLESSERRVFNPGSSIIQYGDISDGLYILMEGNARTTLQSGEGSPAAVVGMLQPGSYFGIISMIDGEPHSATVEAIDNCTCLWVPRQVFGQLMTDLALFSTLLKKMCLMVRGSNEWIRSLL